MSGIDEKTELRLGDRFLMIRALGNGKVNEEIWQLISLSDGKGYYYISKEGSRGIKRRFTIDAALALRTNPHCYRGNANDEVSVSGEPTGTKTG